MPMGADTVRESVIENHLEKLAKENGFLYYKFTSPGRDGVPDRILIGFGHTVFIELKRPGKKPRKKQEYVIGKMRDHGAYVFVIDNKDDCEKLINLLKKRKRKPCRLSL